MSEHGVITDRDRYASIILNMAAVFDLDARIPNQVFKKRAGDSLFCEFDAILSPDFWPTFCAMARWHGDQWVELVVLEPDCDAYYSKYQFYPAVSLSVEASADDYWAAIGYEPPGDTYASMAITANVVTVTGASGEWGCWGERETEVAVFHGFPDLSSRDEWRARFGPFLEASEALESYFPWTFRGRAAPASFAAMLTANYGPPSDSSS